MAMRIDPSITPHGMTMDSTDLNRSIVCAAYSMLPDCKEHWHDAKGCAIALQQVLDTWYGDGIGLSEGLFLQNSISILLRHSAEHSRLQDYLCSVLDDAQLSQHHLRTALRHLRQLGAIARHGQKIGSIARGPNPFTLTVKAFNHVHGYRRRRNSTVRPAKSATTGDGLRMRATHDKTGSNSANRIVRVRIVDGQRVRTATTYKTPVQLELAWSKPES
jgi:hypothetical protein